MANIMVLPQSPMPLLPIPEDSARPFHRRRCIINSNSRQLHTHINRKRSRSSGHLRAHSDPTLQDCLPLICPSRRSEDLTLPRRLHQPLRRPNLLLGYRPAYLHDRTAIQTSTAPHLLQPTPRPPSTLHRTRTLYTDSASPASQSQDSTLVEQLRPLSHLPGARNLQAGPPLRPHS